MACNGSRFETEFFLRDTKRGDRSREQCRLSIFSQRKIAFRTIEAELAKVEARGIRRFFERFAGDRKISA